MNSFTPKLYERLGTTLTLDAGVKQQLSRLVDDVQTLSSSVDQLKSDAEQSAQALKQAIEKDGGHTRSSLAETARHLATASQLSQQGRDVQSTVNRSLSEFKTEAKPLFDAVDAIKATRNRVDHLPDKELFTRRLDQVEHLIGRHRWMPAEGGRDIPATELAAPLVKLQLMAIENAPYDAVKAEITRALAALNSARADPALQTRLSDALNVYRTDDRPSTHELFWTAHALVARMADVTPAPTEATVQTAGDHLAAHD